MVLPLPAAPVNGHDGAFPARRKRLKKTKRGQIFRQLAADNPVMGMIGGPIGLAVVQAGAALRPVLLQKGKGLPGRPPKAAGRLALQKGESRRKGRGLGRGFLRRPHKQAGRQGRIHRAEVRGIQIHPAEAAADILQQGGGRGSKALAFRFYGLPGLWHFRHVPRAKTLLIKQLDGILQRHFRIPCPVPGEDIFHVFFHCFPPENIKKP